MELTIIWLRSIYLFYVFYSCLLSYIYLFFHLASYRFHKKAISLRRSHDKIMHQYNSFNSTPKWESSLILYKFIFVLQFVEYWSHWTRKQKKYKHWTNKQTNKSQMMLICHVRWLLTNHQADTSLNHVMFWFLKHFLPKASSSVHDHLPLGCFTQSPIKKSNSG